MQTFKICIKGFLIPLTMVFFSCSIVVLLMFLLLVLLLFLVFTFVTLLLSCLAYSCIFACFRTLLLSCLAYSRILLIFTPCCYHALLIYAYCSFSYLVVIVPCLLTHIVCFRTLLLSCLAYSCILLVFAPCCYRAQRLAYSRALLLLNFASSCALLFLCLALLILTPCCYCTLHVFVPCYSHALLVHTLLLSCLTLTPYYSMFCFLALSLCLVALLSHLVISRFITLLLRLVVLYYYTLLLLCLVVCCSRFRTLLPYCQCPNITP